MDVKVFSTFILILCVVSEIAGYSVFIKKCNDAKKQGDECVIIKSCKTGYVETTYKIIYQRGGWWKGTSRSYSGYEKECVKGGGESEESSTGKNKGNNNGGSGNKGGSGKAGNGGGTGKGTNPGAALQKCSFTSLRDTIERRRGKRAGCLNSANWYRKRHQGTNDFQWDATLAREAQVYADALMRRSPNALDLVHDPRNGAKRWGENLYAGIRSMDSDEVFCSVANKNWYAEIFDYDYATGRTKGGAIGHFTQMVWTGTVKVGYGVAVRSVSGFGNWDSKIVYVVAKYTPGGNVRGYYNQYVKPRKSLYSAECIEGNKY